MTLSIQELKRLKDLFSTKVLNKEQIVSVITMLDTEPNLLAVLDNRTIQKITPQQAMSVLEKNINCISQLKNNKSKFVSSICDYFSNADYKPTYTLKRNEIDMFIDLYKLHRPFNKPIFNITDSIAKEIIKGLGYDSLRWTVVFQQLSQKQLLKYWKENIYAISFILPKNLTKEMIVAGLNDKNIQMRSICLATINNPKQWSAEMIVKAIERESIGINDISKDKITIVDCNYCLALAELSRWNKVYCVSSLDNATQAYFDLVGNENKDMIRDYLISKIIESYTPNNKVPAK